MQPKTTRSSRNLPKQKKEITFPLDKQNFMIIGIGIVVLIIGYIFLAQDSVDGFMPTVVAPIVLLLGYCVIIPYGILKGKKTQKSEEPAIAGPDIPAAAQTAPQTPSSVSSNIKTGK